MTNRFLGIIMLWCLTSGVTLSMAEDKLSDIERKGAEEKMFRIKADMQKLDVSISFWGKVVDQNNIPVEEASVEIHVEHFSPDADELFGESKTITVKTDNIGAFSIEGEKGRNLYVKSISKAGYECPMLQDTNRSFQYAEHGIQKPFVADKNSPVIFRLRKQNETTFLLHTINWSCQISVSESGKSKGYDLIRREPVRGMTRLVLNDEPLVCDLQMKATFNTNNATWAVILSPGSTNGGIIVSEQLLYEAPEVGYQPEYNFMPEDRKPMKVKYIYLRSRNPAIYSRLEIEYYSATEKSFCIEGKSVTNPYGDRNLEQATDLPYEVTKQLTDEVKSAFRQNKRPTNPDLPKLIKEAKEKAEKDKGKQ